MAELIYTLTTVDSKNHEPNQITDEIISMIDARQHQFLTGLLKLFEHEDQQVTSRIAEKGTQDRQVKRSLF
jgi:hypothetical protein